jgi:hypothetical protein
MQYNGQLLGVIRMGNMDSFTIAVLAGAALVILVFVLLIVLDKGKPSVPAAAPARAGKR